MVSRFESFHIAGVPAGAIIRNMSGRTLTAVTCFRTPDGALVHTESRIEFDPDVFGWTSFEYREHGSNLRVRVDRDDSFGRDCVPSYAEWALIRGMFRAGRTHLSFTSLDESDPDAGPQTAELSITSQPGSLENPSGEVPITGHIVLRVNGEVRNRHWFAGTTLVASDWNGARSFSELTLSAALAGVDSEVEAILRGH